MTTTALPRDDQLQAIRSRMVELKLMGDRNYLQCDIMTKSDEDLDAITNALVSDGCKVKALSAAQLCAFEHGHGELFDPHCKICAGAVPQGGYWYAVRVRIEWNEKPCLLCCCLCGGGK
jgi:hypothetical protein